MLEFPKKRATDGGEIGYFDDSFEAFQKQAETAVQQIEAIDFGAHMLREIREAKAVVRVLRFGKSSTCKLSDVAKADTVCFEELLGNDPLHAVLLKCARDPALRDSLTVAQAFRKLKSVAGVERFRGKGDEMELPKFDLQWLERGKVGYWLMDELTPGGGADALVKWNPDAESAWPTDRDDAPAWSRRPAWIALAHELIHAWRMVTGRVVFHPTTAEYHEEAMTVGLPPYDRCRFTENRFRLAAAEAKRSFYGPSTQAKSEKAAISAVTGKYDKH